MGYGPNGLAVCSCITPRTSVAGRTGTIEPTGWREENHDDATSWWPCGLLQNRAGLAGVSACGPPGFLTGSVDGEGVSAG